MSEIQFLLSFSFISLIWFTWKTFRPRNQHSLRSVAILVLGDIGRSPRMMYHAQSFAENGFVTDLIGYGGSKPIPALERLPRVQLHHLPEIPTLLNILPFVVLAPIKVAHQVISILFLLLWIDVPPEFILVQNPPSIPTLALVQLVGRIRGSRVIIDWHNLGYSILSLKLGKNHIFVRIAKSFERIFGYSAYAHLFVTRAMRDFLAKEWNLQGHQVVLYDRPPQHFHRSSTQEIHELFCKLQPVLSSQKSLDHFLPEANPPYSTAFTHTLSKSGKPASRRKDNLPSPIKHESTYSEVQMPTSRPDRTALLVSSTSWTPDEDFTILLEALRIYESRAREITAKLPTDSRSTDGNLPKLLVILTGKGPLQEKYMKDVGKLQETWGWVKCISLWLEAEDYPILLGSADLGVSLHSSSSELDLPMKVVDMFGCGLPVCALDFAWWVSYPLFAWHFYFWGHGKINRPAHISLNELVKNGKNGLVFQTASQLALQLEELFLSFPTAPALHSLTLGLAELPHEPLIPSNPHIPKQYPTKEQDTWTWSTWEENWGRVVRPLILSDVNL